MLALFEFYMVRDERRTVWSLVGDFQVYGAGDVRPRTHIGNGAGPARYIWGFLTNDQKLSMSLDILRVRSEFSFLDSSYYIYIYIYI